MLTAKYIYIGGWFQRTTLHLSEIYDFLKEAKSPLELDHTKLLELQENIDVESCEMVVGNLDYIYLCTRNGVQVKIFEDGLVVLKKENCEEIKDSISDLTNFYETKLSPGISYIFSLGAPIPKELANIKTIYPYFVVFENATKQTINDLLNAFAQKKYFEVHKKKFEIYRGDKLYIINSRGENLSRIEDFVCEQVFIREFKTQLHRYLNLHRIIWERIADVKERGKISGKDIVPLKERTEGYSKTINLIDARMNQMGAYIKTRGNIAKNNPNLKDFVDVLDFKHETLEDTLRYIKDVWLMTKNYVNSALDLFTTIQAKSTENSVKNLTVVTSMGVGATLIGLFSQKIPEVKLSGVVYFIVVAMMGYFANVIMKKLAMRKLYKISDVKAETDIK
jgi:hypothetical protein